MGKRLVQEQGGSVMVLAAAAILVLLLLAGMALDFGRAHLLRSRLQGAIDAAALAGALEVVPMVELRVSRWEIDHYECIDPITEEKYICTRWISTSPVYVSGERWTLIDQGGWRTAIAPRCQYPYRCSSTFSIIRAWLILPPTAETVARNAFYLNATWPGGSSGIVVEDLTIIPDHQRIAVRATATMRAPTSFLRLAGIDELRFTRTGMAEPVRR